MYVLGARNVHARVLVEEVVGFENNVEVLHGHTAKPKSAMTLADVNLMLTPASLPGAECGSCLQTFKK